MKMLLVQQRETNNESEKREDENVLFFRASEGESVSMVSTHIIFFNKILDVQWVELGKS
jgi:hypothetical protein